MFHLMLILNDYDDIYVILTFCLGTLLDLKHRSDVEVKRIRDLHDVLKQHDSKELEVARRRQESSPGVYIDNIAARSYIGGGDDDDDDNLVYAINANAKVSNEKARGVHISNGAMMVPPLGNNTKDDDYDDPKNENADKDEEFESLSRILQESIASARSSSQNSSRQTHINIPVRAFPPMSRGVPGKSLYIFHIRRTFHTHSSCSYSIKFLDSARVSSVHRKTRRFTYFMSLYQQLAGKDDNLDVFVMKRLLMDQEVRLLHMIDFYRQNRVDLPMIKREYEHDLSLMVNSKDSKKHPSFQCNPVLALICVHLLNYSPKLQSLMSIYKQKGRASLSRVGFFTAAEECFQLLENKFFYEKRVEKGSILEQLLKVCRMRVSKTAILEEQAVGHDTAVFMRCEFHGESAFYASDLFCQQCDVDYGKLED